MTRRAEPEDRIKELSDASVPFSFDIHAIVKCEDAPFLENTLHKHFDEKRMNKINNRKEFFRVNIQEIEAACNELGLKVKLTKSAEAREFRDSIDFNKAKKAA
jgi:hypothetical protein